MKKYKVKEVIELLEQGGDSPLKTYNNEKNKSINQLEWE